MHTNKIIVQNRYRLTIILFKQISKNKKKNKNQIIKKLHEKIYKFYELSPFFWGGDKGGEGGWLSGETAWKCSASHH